MEQADYAAFDLGKLTGFFVAGKNIEILDSWDYDATDSEGEMYRTFNVNIYNLLKKNRPKIVFYENVQGVWQSPQAQNYYVTMRGIMLMHCYTFNIESRGYNQMTLKKAVTGNGRAKKPQIERWAKNKYPRLEFKNDDEADAIMIMDYGLMEINGTVGTKKPLNNQTELPFYLST